MLFGFEPPYNFKSPYFASNIKDFWNRWHISLSSFFRDYIYIPLGGNRRGKMRQYINFMIVFLVSGLWHGAGVSFILWGAVIFGIVKVCRVLGKKRREKKMKKQQLKAEAAAMNKAENVPVDAVQKSK